LNHLIIRTLVCLGFGLFALWICSIGLKLSAKKQESGAPAPHDRPDDAGPRT